MSWKWVYTLRTYELAASAASTDDGNVADMVLNAGRLIFGVAGRHGSEILGIVSLTVNADAVDANGS
jgi:hypothetical protein